jgi:hypothetical protein
METVGLTVRCNNALPSVIPFFTHNAGAHLGWIMSRYFHSLDEQWQNFRDHPNCSSVCQCCNFMSASALLPSVEKNSTTRRLRFSPMLFKHSASIWIFILFMTSLTRPGFIDFEYFSSEPLVDPIKES